MRRSITVTSIKKKHRSLSSWCKTHKVSISQTNDLLSRRGPFKDMLIPRESSNGYAILQMLVREGYEKELKADGWNTDLLVRLAPNEEPMIVSRTAITTYVKGTLSTNLDEIQLELCALGDSFNCSVYSAIADGGPAAMIYMMEGDKRSTVKAVEFLNARFTSLKFYMETSSNISVWND